MPTAPIRTREIPAIPARASDAHKGTVGRIMVVGGCVGEHTMVGAPALTANAALKSGAGLVQMVVPSKLQIAIATLAPCATVRSLTFGGRDLVGFAEEFAADVVAIGPGMGDSVRAGNLKKLILGFDGPIVLDADGLNLLAKMKAFEIPVSLRVILTPHPGEAKRLLRGRGVDLKVDSTNKARQAIALALHEAYGCTIVLKGSGTVVTDGERIYVNETGNAGMATGGAGDVLTGVIAALLGQCMEPLEACILGAYLHGLSGDFAAQEMGRLSITALDLIASLSEAITDQDPIEP